jgi:hypothetical protein
MMENNAMHVKSLHSWNLLETKIQCAWRLSYQKKLQHEKGNLKFEATNEMILSWPFPQKKL